MSQRSNTFDHLARYLLPFYSVNLLEKLEAGHSRFITQFNIYLGFCLGFGTFICEYLFRCVSIVTTID